MDSRSRMVISAVVPLAMLACCRPAQALQPGDKAPPLSVARWVKGDPILLADGRGQTVYVVQFWATASPQCVGVNPVYTALQKKFAKQGVVCIAVTDEPAETVAEFIKKKGGQIGYRVALDDGRKTHQAYLEAAGVRGIPHAFIIDRAGRIAWHGHPLDDLEKVLARVVAGDYKPEPPVRRGGGEQPTQGEATTLELLERLNRAYDFEEWEQVVGCLDQLIERNPDDRRYIMVKLHVLITRIGDVSRATEWGLSLVGAHREEADFLNELSWRLLTTEEYGSRCMKLAYEAAVAADKASQGTRPDVTDTLARALYQIGRLDEAIRLQEKALRLAQEQDIEEVPLQEMRHTLRYYRDCAAVRERATAVGH